MPSTPSRNVSLKTFGAVVLALMVGTPATAQPPVAPVGPGVSAHSTHEKQISEAFAHLPLTFVENMGQTDPQVRYHAQGSDYSFFFTEESIVLSLSEDSPVGSSATPRTSVLAMDFVGADDGVVLEARTPTGAQVNYVHGNDPSRWNTGLSGYSEIVYDDLWPGVDMLLRGQDGELKYEFHLEPGTDPGVIGLDYDGANSLTVDSSGTMQIRTALGALKDSAPVSYQEIDGTRVPVTSSFQLNGGTAYGFDLGPYQTEHPLVIDPGLDYSTLVGGSSADRAEAITVDADGNAIIVGSTQSTDFPTTTGTVDRTFSGGIMDAFVTKLNADGSGLVYSTYLGGTPTPTRRGNTEQTETARDVAVDAAGNAYITGQTSSGDFPTTSGAFQQSLSIGEQTATDGFVTKLSPTGTLQYSTFLGGASSDDGRSIAVDADGNAYIGGSTFSSDFPITAGAFDTSFGGGEDVFVTKLNATGSALGYSTFLGGAENELSAGIAVDAAGNAFVTGSTRSLEFPTTAGSFQPTHSGGGFGDLFEVFVTKLNSAGDSLAWSTFLGGTRVDRAAGLDIDSAGNTYVIGGTLSPEFPTTAGAFDTSFDSTSEAFVAKLGADGADLRYSTHLNGASPGAITIDAANNAWLGGRAEAGVTTTPDAHQATNAGSGDAYVAQLNDTGSDLLYATYLGGTDNESASGIALDPNENIYITGTTLSSDFPTTPGAFDRLWAGDISIFWGDAFVAKFGANTAPPPPPPADETAPTVSISTPQPGATVSGIITVSAAASDNVGVTEVAFFANGTPIGTDTTAPYNTTWDTTAVADGSVDLTATATDAAGNTGNATTVTVTVDNSAPAPTLASLTLDPTTVTGGNTSTGTVTLDAPAPAGGITVSLASSNANTTIPASVTINEGSIGATFTINTTTVSADTSATITATHEGTTRTATLTITAPAATETATTTFSGRIDKNQTLNRTVSSGTGTVTFDLNWNESRVDLDLRITDPSGNQVHLDTSSARPKTGEFTASISGDYRFTLINNTNRRTNYTLNVTHPVDSADAPADTTAPTVSVSSPAEGSTVSGVVAVSAEASDNVGVSEVRFFADGVLLGADATSPYEAAWDTTTVPDGSHNLTAIAVDATGNSTTSTAVTVTVENTPTPPPADTTAPTVSISEPSDGATVSGTVSITANASDDVGVTEVRFLHGTTLIGTDTTDPYGISWDTTIVVDGEHTLTAVAVDAASNTTTSEAVTVTVENPVEPPADTEAPAVGISSPTDGAEVSGTITVAATAADNVGVSQVVFSVDDTAIGADETAPYEISWDTTALPDGDHVLTATAFDAAGNTGNAASVTVTIDNSAPAPTLASLALDPTSVTGGNSSTGTVTLDAAAPAGGTTVSLVSSNTNATVPASVTINEGFTGATFTINTVTVSADTSATITAAHNTTSRTATLTIAAPATTTTTSTFTGQIDDNQTLNRAVSSGAGTVTFSLDWDESRVDLDLRVTDPAGNVVYVDAGSTRPKNGSFTASSVGDYLFTLINNTDRDADYALNVAHPVR